MTTHGRGRRVGLKALVVVAVSAATLAPTLPAGAIRIPRTTVLVSPNTNLESGEVVTVKGNGYAPSPQTVYVGQCSATGTTLLVDDCDNIISFYVDSPNWITFTTPFTVQRYITTSAGTIDCSAPDACTIGTTVFGGLLGSSARISFSVPTVVPGGAVVAEGNSATTELQVPVSLSKASTQTITVEWRTASVSGAPPPYADPGTDFTAASGTVTFAPGETAQTVSISVNGDTLVEPNEWIVVSFKHPTNAKMGGWYGLGFGVIINDD
jgi:fibronectin-binding autotransporter adhesin